MKMTHNIGWRLLRIAAVTGIAAVLVGILLFPNLDRVRENAQRVNDLSNLNAIYKAISGWGLDPGDSFRPPFPPSLDQLVKEKKITKEMLVNYTGKPIEYYPAGDNVILVSYGKHGRNIVRCSGSGMWIDDGTPEAATLDQQLAELKKQEVGNLLGAGQPPIPQSESSKRLLDNDKTAEQTNSPDNE